MRVLYVGHNIKLAETMFNLSYSGIAPQKRQIDHLSTINGLEQALSVHDYSHLICDDSLNQELIDLVERTYPNLCCTYLAPPVLGKQTLSPSKALTDEFNILCDMLTIPTFLKNRLGEFTACNASFASLFGCTVEQVIGKKEADILPPELIKQSALIDQKIFIDRQVHCYDFQLCDASGHLLDMRCRKEVSESTQIQIGMIFDFSEQVKTQQLLELEQIKLRASTDTTNDLIFFKDLESRFVGCNKQFEKFVGGSEQSILGKSDEQLFLQEQALMCLEQDRYVISNKEVYQGEEYLTYNDGARHFINMKKVPLQDSQGKMLGLIGIGRDITEQHVLEKQLNIAKVVFENSNDSILVTDENGKIAAVNESSCRISGYQKNELLTKNINLLSSELHNVDLYNEIKEALKTQKNWQGDISYQTKNGNVYYAWLEVYVVKHVQENIVNHVYSYTDLTQNKSAQEKIKYLSKHDPLTGLLNRIALFRRLEDAISRADYKETPVAVILLKINSVKAINEQYGHNMGDAVLKESAQRLKACIGDKYTLARLWGDEFVLIVDEFESEQNIALLAHEIAERFNEKYVIGDLEVNLFAMIGISIYPDDGDDVDTLLFSAEKAMLRGKTDRSHAYHFYTATLTKHSKQQLDFEGELQRGVQLDQFELYYQPQYDLNKRQIVALESLLRWNHPKHGVLLPDRFLMLAEDRGMLIPIGLKMIRTAAKQAVTWNNQNISFGRISINLSLVQLEQLSLVADLQSILKETNCLSRYLEFEINEKIFNSDSIIVHNNLLNLSKMGFALTVDNFGADIALMPLLEKLQIEKFKISRDYTKAVPGRLVGEAMIKSIITLSRSLGVDVVGEGIETEQQERFFNDQQIDSGQGDFQAKAMKSSEATFYLRCNKRK